MIDYVASSLKEHGPLTIQRFDWIWPSLAVSGDGWALGTTSPWRVLGADGALEFSGTMTDVERFLASLVGLSLVGVSPQGTAMPGDPCFLLSDQRMLEIFSDVHIDPWVLHLPDIAYVGTPGDPKYFLPGMP